MTTAEKIPSLAFLWRSNSIAGAVLEAARRSGARALFDVCTADIDAVGLALVQADAGGDGTDLKISPQLLGNSALEEILGETGINRLWVELYPAALDADPKSYLDIIEELSSRYTVIPVVSNVELIAHIINERPAIGELALKGSESSGFVSCENTLVLLGMTRKMLEAAGRSMNLSVWGGVASPEAAAALLAVGVNGIVFESVHWLTDLVSTDEETRKKIAKLRPEHTDLIGMNLEAACRLFNKGNSRAVKELKEFTGSLCGAEITDEQRRALAGKINEQAIHALDSGFGRDELVPLGVEAAFAESFVRRFGTRTDEAFGRFRSEVERLLARAGEKIEAFDKSKTARAMGTRYPFVQGAMSWITDVPEFARAVADAGGLPTIALGMMDGFALVSKLSRLDEIMADRPYAVNVITLAENPHRDEQLAWILSMKPKFAVIAAGEPSHAEDLLQAGIEVIYIAPNEELMRMAFEVGVRWVICEGNEAGGHVGEHSTLTLAQMVLDLRDREPELFADRRVILAGGVCDRVSAFTAAMLGADAVQMGTCYLATREIVESGALTELYQHMIVQSAPGSTAVTGEATGLRVRSLRTPRIESICSLERDFAAGAEDEGSFRHKIEALGAGSLFVAARGLDKPGGASMDEAQCKELGQFMSGACAGSLAEVRTLAELHQELAAGALPRGLPFLGPVCGESAPRIAGVEIDEAVPSSVKVGAVQPVVRAPRQERIAITGMSAVNSLGKGPEKIWAASLAMKSGIIDVPSSKWNHEQFYDPRPRAPEKTYCKVGAFQNIDVSRKEVGIPPQDFRTMTDSTRITMWLAKHAVEDSGILDSDIPRERIGVLISQNSGEAAATLEDVIIRGAVSNIISSVQSVVPLEDDAARAIEEAVKSGRMAIDDTTLLGRLNCTAGGFICKKYGFMGPSFAVSAACATALVALFSAYQMIRNGIIDAAVIGGAEEPLTPMHFLEFSALGALAGLSGKDRPPHKASRPFDAERDGMVLGEGGGMIVIERESVARKRGAQVYAYITGMGASNNHLGLVESSRITQEIAMEASYNDAGYGADSVDMVECHATSTVQGDVEEVLALKRFFHSNGSTILTSFKSQIGHTLGASGVNSLVRGIMALNSGIFPATLNYEHPDPEMNLDGTGLYVLGEPAEWQPGNGRGRRFQVNAFGFGGSNYVVQLEQAMEREDMVLVHPEDATADGHTRVKALKLDGISFFRTQIGNKAYRLGVVADSEQQARSLVSQVEPIQNGGGVPAKRLRTLARKGIHLGSADVAAANLAFVFPGQGSHYAGMSHELYQTFPVIREWMDRAAQVADFDLLHLLFHDREEDLQKTRWQQPALFTMEYAMVQYLVSLGIRPTALAGHSLGELTALCLAGVYSFEDGFRIVNKRAVCMDKACEMNVDPGVMMAVDAPLDYLEKRLSELQNVYITNLNSPRQIVIGGDTAAVKALGIELKEAGWRSTMLRVSMAFHSPIMRCIHDELEEFVAGIEFHAPQIPVISNTTMKAFPDVPDEMKKIVMAHLESPVHWMQNVRTLWNDYGVRLFVEVGPRDILSNMISDSLEEAQCIQTCLPSAEALIYRTALAQLYALGHLDMGGQPESVVFPGQESREAALPATIGAVSGVKPSPVARIAASGDPLETIVQREINSFVMESFGRFLKPTLLNAIRSGYDPGYSEDKLDDLLARMFPRVASIAAVPIPPVVPVSQIPAPATGEPKSVQPAKPAAQQEPEAAADATDDVTESIIRIIMETTGYERDEIEPDMDLREDLSIRSSRLPVIMDSVESRFGIKIEIEEFMDVRTIKDISEKITKVVARQKGDNAGAAAAGRPGAASDGMLGKEAAQSERDEKPEIKRIVFTETPLEEGSFLPLEIDSMDSVLVFSAGGGTGLRKRVGNVLRRDYGVHPVPLAFLFDESSEGEEGFDLRTDEGAKVGCEILLETETLAGMVLIVDDLFEQRIGDPGKIACVLAGIFDLLKTFVGSPSKKFVLLVNGCSQSQGPGKVMAEGILGMFLSLAHEFSSILFRSIRLEENAGVRDAIRGAFDRSREVIELIYRDENAFTMEGRPVPWRLGDTPRFELTSEDVVVVSGGGRGITSYLARNLVPFGCRMVLLGRSELRGGAEKGSPNAGTAEILDTLEDLKSSGLDASYYRCDVSNPEETKSVLGKVAERYGRVTGIIHGAGFLRDGFFKQMSTEDFSAVVNVKYLGALNLFDAAEPYGLRFFTCLSSAAAIQGNPGQVNYAAGNRMMSALASYLAQRNNSVRCKALMLPPIEGAGMAVDPDIRALMERMNAAYVDVDELAGLFCRELFLGEAEHVWVMFMRSLPDIPSVRLITSNPDPGDDAVRVVGVMFPRQRFPMVDQVTKADLASGKLTATRAFSPEKDPWIVDHKPFKFMKHPLVSAIMAVETFMEASKMLYPHLDVLGIQQAQFLDIIECPPGMERLSEIRCRRVDESESTVLCDLSLATRAVSPSGRVLDRVSANYKARVSLGSAHTRSDDRIEGFPVELSELGSPPMEQRDVQAWYDKRTEMKGRYRVINEMYGTGPDTVKGSIIYRVAQDFAPPRLTVYQYPPYLLEGLMQVMNFYIIMRDQNESRSMIPFRIGEMGFFRHCADGEKIEVDARVKDRDDDGITWNAVAFDADGKVIMYVRDLIMRWFTA